MLILGLIDLPLWLILIPVCAVAVYWYGTRNHNYLRAMGIPGPEPIPFIGVSKKFMRTSIYTQDSNNIKKYGKVYGIFKGNTPEVTVADHDMLTEIAIKQFHFFTDRRPVLSKGSFISNSVFNQRGDVWKSTRSKMSPTFTTGKLRQMSAEINRSARSLGDRLKQMNKPFEAKFYLEQYTMDCIASTAYGLRLDSQKDDNNDFNRFGRKLINVNIKSRRVMFLMQAPTWLVSILGFLGMNLSIFDVESDKFFTKIIDQAFKSREAGAERADFLQLMLKAQKGQNIHDADDPEHRNADSNGLTRQEILANAMFFFVAGFETVSLGVTYLLYCLACDQQCQNKVIEEVDRHVQKEGEITYEIISKLNYLDQCLSESLRIYPPAFRVDRKATHDTVVGGYKIKKGLLVNIPILAIHRDPEIWPDPMKFDPDRFSRENKPNIKQTHWMPFGIGPRNCIGMRQALFEVKVAAVEILKTHRMVTCEKTEIPLTMSSAKSMKAVNGVWIELERRN